MQLHGIEANLHSILLGVFRHRSFGGKQRQLRGSLATFIEDFDDPAPCFSLAVVDLAEIENLPLYDLAPSTAFALNNIPIEMFLAVLQSSIAFQIHDAGV
jgi:hypothetical protein